MTPLRIGYTCHDAFPSTHTNTQQIFWTLSEVARLGHQVDLCVPAVRGGADARALIGAHYGAPDGTLPDGLRLMPAREAFTGSTAAKGWFDLRAAWRFSRRTHDVVWTRDPLAFAAALQWRLHHGGRRPSGTRAAWGWSASVGWPASSRTRHLRRAHSSRLACPSSGYWWRTTVMRRR